MNKYFLKARLYPVLITMMPVLLLYYFTLGTKLNQAMHFIIAVPIALHLAIGCGLIYGLTQLNRFIGKEIFQRIYFKEESAMPTTNFLLHKNLTLSRDMKTKLRNKIHHDFQIQLLNEQEEYNNDVEARKQIIFAVSQIRNHTRKNAFLLQHNIEYGFIRNLVGGSLFATLVCIVDLYFFRFVKPNSLAYQMSFVFLICYIIILVCSKWAISRNGKTYAKVLFEQYLSK